MIQAIPLDLEAEELAHRVRRSLRIRDDHRDEEWDRELCDTDDYLPELSVAFEDPDGSHFRDTLLWVYTGDSKRWVNSFTPKNYEHILKNVFRLNMVTQQVLEDCQAWEEAIHPDLGLQGLAHAHFFASLAAANDTH
ncbi:hypothetical protein BGZ98_008205 [Dissophora globulifera]|nr:hypothetical protein BGZ98_008205 [Dissophora globulifera]